MIPVIEETVRPAGIGTYGIGCVPEFDAEAMTLIIGPGVMRTLLGPGEGNGLREEFAFPGGEVSLPPSTTEVWIGRKRDDGKPYIIVNCGRGIDDVTYEPIHIVLRLGDVGWILEHWRCDKLDLPRWAQSKYKTPPNPEKFRRKRIAKVVIVEEFPSHLRASMERDKMREEAGLRLGLLLRKGDRWTDDEKEQALRDLIMAADIELPQEVLGG